MTRVGTGALCRSCSSGPLLPGTVPGTPRRLTHEGRGLCGTCYDQHIFAGTLAQFPRLTRNTEDLAEMAERIKRERRYTTWRDIAEDLGVSRDAVMRAVQRRRAAVRAAAGDGGR